MTCKLKKSILKTSDGKTVCAAILANTPWLRLRGLLGRKLNIDDGLLIIPCNSVHMIGMKYPIDVIYLTKENKIVKIVKNLRPWQFSACRKAHKTLEISTENIESKSLNIGDSLLLEDMRTL